MGIKYKHSVSIVDASQSDQNTNKQQINLTFDDTPKKKKEHMTWHTKHSELYFSICTHACSTTTTTTTTAIPQVRFERGKMICSLSIQRHFILRWIATMDMNSQFSIVNFGHLSSRPLFHLFVYRQTQPTETTMIRRRKMIHRKKHHFCNERRFQFPCTKQKQTRYSIRN